MPARKHLRDATPDICRCCGQILPQEGTTEPKSGYMRVGTHKIWMTPSQASLYAALSRRKGGIVSYDFMYELLYWRRSDGEVPEEQTLRVFVSKLRRALKPTGRTIRNAYGVGYFLE